MCKYFIFYLAFVTKVITEVLRVHIHVVTYSENEPRLFNLLMDPETVCGQITVVFNECDHYTACCKLLIFILANSFLFFSCSSENQFQEDLNFYKWDKYMYITIWSLINIFQSGILIVMSLILYFSIINKIFQNNS